MNLLNASVLSLVLAIPFASALANDVQEEMTVAVNTVTIRTSAELMEALTKISGFISIEDSAVPGGACTTTSTIKKINAKPSNNSPIKMPYVSLLVSTNCLSKSAKAQLEERVQSIEGFQVLPANANKGVSPGVGKSNGKLK